MWLGLIIGWIAVSILLAPVVGRALQRIPPGEDPAVKVSDEVWETPLGLVVVTVHQPTPGGARTS